MDADIRAKKLMQARACYHEQYMNTKKRKGVSEEKTNTMGYLQTFLIRSIMVLFLLVCIGFWGMADSEKYTVQKEWLIEQINHNFFMEEAYAVYKEIPYTKIADELVALLGL